MKTWSRRELNPHGRLDRQPVASGPAPRRQRTIKSRWKNLTTYGLSMITPVFPLKKKDPDFSGPFPLDHPCVKDTHTSRPSNAYNLPKSRPSVKSSWPARIRTGISRLRDVCVSLTPRANIERRLSAPNWVVNQMNGRTALSPFLRPAVSIFIALSTFLFTLSTDPASAAPNTWDTLAAAPGGVDLGGSLVYPGSGDTIYAFRGNNTTTFWAYSIANNTWETKAAAPAPVYDGGALAYPGSGDTIYAFGGNLTTTFWAYSIANNTWETKAATPAT